MRISLCMIVKNEEDNIINCLERALKVVDEAIVVDTGSTDKTKVLLEEKYGDDTRVKIFEEKWEDDFSKARNKSLEHATGDWILILDADERIFCNREELEVFLSNKDYPAYIIPIYNIYDKNSFTVSASMVRLYKNNNPKYKGAIHEQLEINGQGYLGEAIDKDICKIYHYGYSSSVFREKNKSKRNMDIIKEEIKRNPEDPFNWYNKGVMEMIDRHYERALDDFIKAHKLCHNIRRSFHNDLLIRMIQCMMMLKNYNQTAEFIESISKDIIMKNMPDIYYYLGICYTRLKKFDEAIKNFKKAVDIGEYYNGISKFGVGSFLSMIEWAKVLELKGEKLLAIEKYKEAVFNKNNIGKQGLDELKRLLKKEKMTAELNQLEKMLSNNCADSSNVSISEKSKIKNDEFERYKKEVKESIQTLIENRMIKEAKESIKEYENIVKNDIDIYSIKGVIAMMEGDMGKAEKEFQHGLDIDKSNFDLLYNLGYLYQSIGKEQLAMEYYKKAIQNAKNENDINEVHEMMKML
ncbi:MAG TPA: tetratricopeptide repeat protein [Clostridiaceae bacterium]|nr:tetratricopeptide repeat protein [Clostridiaceae bacterium]